MTYINMEGYWWECYINHSFTNQFAINKKLCQFCCVRVHEEGRGFFRFLLLVFFFAFVVAVGERIKLAIGDEHLK